MARPFKETEKAVIVLSKSVMETLAKDAKTFGMEKSAYISQLIMQKHLEMTAAGLLEKLTPQQIQMVMENEERREHGEISSNNPG
jgi:hypothetical protein